MSEVPPESLTGMLGSVRSLRDLEAPHRERLFEAVYEELRRLAGAILGRREGTLTPTALVHEAYMRLVSGERLTWDNRAHFLAIAARAMRQVLVDQARARSAQKRGGDLNRVTLDSNLGVTKEPEVEILDLNRAMDKLSTLDSRMARVAEMRVFAGLTMKEVAEVLGVSKRTADGDWSVARRWLSRELTGEAA